MECGGKRRRSATPLSNGQWFAFVRWRLVRAKAVSSLRFATALHRAFAWAAAFCGSEPFGICVHLCLKLPF